MQLYLQEWFTVFEQHRRTNCVVSDLVMGNEYIFRVYAINMVGQSQEACNSQDSAYIQKTGACHHKPLITSLTMRPPLTFRVTVSFRIEMS